MLGPGGTLTGLTKQVLETALDQETADHFGYDRHDPVGRNGTRTTTVIEVCPVELDVSRDR